MKNFRQTQFVLPNLQNLKQQINAKTQSPEFKTINPKERNLEIKNIIDKFFKEQQNQVISPSSSSSTTTATLPLILRDEVSNLKPLSSNDQTHALICLVQEKSLPYAIKVATNLGPSALDLFHDALIHEYLELINKKTTWERIVDFIKKIFTHKKKKL